MARSDGLRDDDGGNRRGERGDASVRPTAGDASPFSADDISPAEQDPRTIRTPEAGAYGRTDPWYDPAEEARWTGLLAGDGCGEPGWGADLDSPRRPVNAEDVRLGLGSHRPRAPQASPRAEATPDTARATRADEPSSYAGPEGWPWLMTMTPVEEPLPETEPGWGTPWGLLVAVAATFVLGGLIVATLEWLK